MRDLPYFERVELLLRLLPLVAHEHQFALKGGTAINLFVRDLPRLSVDIDLTFVPIGPRDAAITEIRAALERIRDRVLAAVRDARCTLTDATQAPKLLVRTRAAGMVKIEPNTVWRGVAFEAGTRGVTPAVESAFERAAEMLVVSDGDLYGGKLVAALDRQHPRDLFDVMLLLENEGVTDQIRLGFVAYLASHHRPIAEVLRPQEKDIARVFETEFVGMTLREVALRDLLDTRARLIERIHASLTAEDRQLLLSLKLGEPQWGLLPQIPNLSLLPAVQWKLQNVHKMRAATPDKHQQSVEKLRRILEL